MKSKISIAVLLLITLLLQACGSPHVRPRVEVLAADLGQYKTAYTAAVKVESKEQNADSLAVNKKMAQYARQKLSEMYAANGYNEVSAPSNEALEFKFSLHISYGSRALRYFVGFGAGKGRVTSKLEVIDSLTKTVKYSADGASDLAIGAFGGSMEVVVQQNIDEQIYNYLSNKNKKQ